VTDNLLWVDVETTGLHPDRHRLLEVGFRVTTSDLETVAETSLVIPYTPASVESLRRDASAVVQQMHDTSGLWAACAAFADLSMHYATPRSSGAWDVIARPLIDWVTEHAPTEPLAGSSVHFDRAWLTAWLPDVLHGRTHRHVDVSTLRELAARWHPKVVESRPTPTARHRVLSDLDDSIAELRHYADAFGMLPTAVTS
jgi:oligoribonuclease